MLIFIFLAKVYPFLLTVIRLSVVLLNVEAPPKHRCQGSLAEREELSTIDLLALTSLEMLFFIFKMFFFFFYKTTYRKKEVNGTEPSPLISVPCRCLKIVACRNHRDRKKQSYCGLYSKNRFEPILTGQHFLFLLRQFIEWKETEHSRFLSNLAEKSFIVVTTVLRRSPSGGYSQSFLRTIFRYF